MDISVSKTQIGGAKQKDSHRCMIADAISDRVKGKYILVDVQSIRWSDPKRGKRFTFFTPPVAQRAIIAFDQGRRVKPFRFTLGSPVEVRSMKRIRTGDRVKVQKARAAYEARSKRRTRRSKRTNVAAREREFGVRKLQA